MVTPLTQLLLGINPRTGQADHLVNIARLGGRKGGREGGREGGRRKLGEAGGVGTGVRVTF